MTLRDDKFSFQNFLAANSQCWWNTPLTAATKSLKYAGHVAPGMLLVTAEPCALEILRGAYARSVLKPPATYAIMSVGKSTFIFHSLHVALGIEIRCYCFSLSLNLSFSCTKRTKVKRFKTKLCR